MAADRILRAGGGGYLLRANGVDFLLLTTASLPDGPIIYGHTLCWREPAVMAWTEPAATRYREPTSTRWVER